jgi:MoxR-like ATPase
MNLSIPSIARGAVRSYVKSLAGFDAFAASLGVASRDVKNADLVAFAEREGKLAYVEAIIAQMTGGAVPSVEQTVATAKAADVFAPRAVIDNVAEDARVEASIKSADILADVEQFLSPFVRAEIEKALAPVIAAANKPALIVEVQAAPVAPKGAAPYPVRTGGKVPFNKLFGTSTSHAFGKMPISLWNSYGRAPQPDPFFIVDAKNMGLLATAAEHEANVWLVGPASAGKSTMPFQFAAFTGRPITRIGFDRQTSTETLIGSDRLVEGEVPGTMVSKWFDGVLLAAMKVPGMVILIDEPTFAPAGVQAIIQQVSDEHRMYTIHSTGEVVKCAPGVIFVIADNTNGSGDEAGQYAGTNVASGALVNRFARMVRVDYLSRAQEVQALVNHTQIPSAAAGHVVDFVAQVRKLPELEGFVMGLRQMVAFVRTVKDGFAAKDAFEVSFLTRLPSTERAVVQTMATMQWATDFENLLSGSTSSTEPSSVPSDSAGAQAFDDEVSASLNR